MSIVEQLAIMWVAMHPCRA